MTIVVALCCLSTTSRSWCVRALPGPRTLYDPRLPSRSKDRFQTHQQTFPTALREWPVSLPNTSLHCTRESSDHRYRRIA
ncbi:hypothetical protein BDR06DRAFT_567382 [Suillus hirtellus]|nr:hypothetical protein BDR06DRAFT_567382 [Suillus hirtellus]